MDIPQQETEMDINLLKDLVNILVMGGCCFITVP